MNKLFKRTTAGILTVVTATTLALSASAVEWTATGQNFPGAPSGVGTKDAVVVYHKAAGAQATCLSATHTNSSTTDSNLRKAYTTITCTNFVMNTVLIIDTGSEPCLPSVGKPIKPIMVEYEVAASSPMNNNTVTTTGKIEAK